MQKKLLKEVIRKEIRKLLREVSLTIPNILPTGPRPRYRSWYSNTDLATWERQAQKQYGTTWGHKSTYKLVPKEKEFRTKVT